VQLSLVREGMGVRLTVRDFGTGVPPESLPQLGQPFYRPDAARTRHVGGVGLGLCLCRLVAEAHGGRLELGNAEPGFEASVRFS
jgi:signal transduction histidine kinase